jgi:hypothetical protein
LRVVVFARIKFLSLLWFNLFYTLAYKSGGYMKRGVLLIILVLILAGGIGTYVYSQNKNEETTVNSDPSVSTQSSVDYLVIREWGIRMKLNDKIMDAKYKMADDSKGIYLSTASAEKIHGCQTGGIMGLERAKQGESLGATIANDNNIPPMIKIGDYYYLNTGPSFVCAGDNDTAGKNKIGQVREGYSEAIKTLESVN